MLFSQSIIALPETTGHQKDKNKFMTHKKISEQLFVLWEVRQENTELIRIGSLLAVAALELSLPYLWPILKMPNTKVIVVILGLTLTLMVSFLSQDSLKKRYSVNWMLISSPMTAVLTMEMTTQMISELLKISHRWFCSMEHMIQSPLTQTPNLFMIVPSQLVYHQHWSL